MTNEQINDAIAEAIQWTGGWLARPDYCGDLNAMDKAEETLTSNQWEVWHRTAAKLFLSDEQPYHSRLSARQRAEVFLRTVGKWEEGK